MSNPTAAVNAGSFRDRDGRVYHFQDRVLRGLSDSALQNFRQLQEKSFYIKLVESGKVIGTREIPAEENPLPDDVQAQWAGFLEHDPVPVISYPYEWTFSMLKAAASLQLHLVERAVSNGFMLKDATPYNIQFVNRKPVFIDIPSFEPLLQGVPWSGYRQFCEMFLFPLFLQAYKGCDFQPFMRAAINGIDVQVAATLFGFRDRFRKGVMSHVWLQAKLDRRFGGSSEDVRSSLKSAGFNRELILVNVRKLQKLVRKLAWQAAGSKARLANDLPENDRRQDYLRATLERGEDGGLVADPFALQDSSMLSRLAQAGCLVVRPPHAPAARAGEIVEIIPFEQGLAGF